jgi:cobalamin biosynthesis protein CobD/CbiB
VEARLKSIQQVQAQLRDGAFDLTRHALNRVVERDISEEEIRQAGVDAAIIEDYPDDKYSPSCLLLGFTGAGRPLHLHVSLVDSQLVRIVTLYEPGIDRWTEYSRRK